MMGHSYAVSGVAAGMALFGTATLSIPPLGAGSEVTTIPLGAGVGDLSLTQVVARDSRSCASPVGRRCRRRWGSQILLFQWLSGQPAGGRLQIQRALQDLDRGGLVYDPPLLSGTATRSPKST